MARGEEIAQVGPSAAESLVSQGASLIRIENDAMLQVATRRPRDESKVLQGALGELLLVPEQAKEAFYVIPYRERQLDGSYKIVNVQGPSIDAATALARRWGNCTVTARIVNEDAEGFDIEGVFLDLETNYRISKPFRVGKYQKSKGGQVYQLDPQRALMAIQAGASKAIRNAVLSGLPKYLVNAYYEKARQLAAGSPDAKADPKRLEALLKAFERFKVTKEMLERYAERPASDWTGEEIANLRGVWNALNDKQITVEDLFGGGEAKPANGNAPVTVTPESIAGGVTTGHNDAGTPTPEERSGPMQREACKHPTIPPSRVDALPVGASLVCPDCGEEFVHERGLLDGTPPPRPGRKGGRA